MPPRLALVLTLGLIVFLFYRESRGQANQSRALWIPLLWVLIIGTRFVGQWIAVLSGGSMGASNVAMEDGSPLDRLVFLGLILAGFNVLRQRRIKVWDVLKNNGWLAVFLGYCFLAILWSDFPFVAFKRWIKVLGHPVMALVVVTEPNPIDAVRRLMKRAAFVLVPINVLLIKYYPEIGRGFDQWTGSGYNRGASLTKNELGYVGMLFGLFFISNVLTVWRAESGRARRDELLVSGGFLVMIWWLLVVADSATSVGCTVGGALTIVILGFRWVSKRHVGWYVLGSFVAFAIAEQIWGVYAGVLDVLGRDATLTDRTEVWADVFRLTTNPLFGAGFESFWLGDRLNRLGAKWWWQPTQAHNGYIETYINLGWVGVFIVLGMIVGTFRRIRRDLLEHFEFARFRMALLTVIVVYNFTEATFKSLHPLWTVFYIIGLSYGQPGTVLQHVAPPSRLPEGVTPSGLTVSRMVPSRRVAATFRPAARLRNAPKDSL